MAGSKFVFALNSWEVQTRHYQESIFDLLFTINFDLNKSYASKRFLETKHFLAFELSNTDSCPVSPDSVLSG